MIFMTINNYLPLQIIWTTPELEPIFENGRSRGRFLAHAAHWTRDIGIKVEKPQV